MNRLLVPALITVLSVACLATPPRDPDIVGVVVDVEDLAGPLRRFTVRDGASIELDLDRATLLDDSQGGQDPGTLLLAGEEGGAQWYMSLVPDGECFLMGSYGTDADDSIVFDNGLRLPKADGFDPGGVTDGRYDEHPQGHFCVSEDGEVASYDA